MIKQYHLYIAGDVQGVGLRYTFSNQARFLGLVGWVKNLFDGRVEAIIQGNEENVKKIINWLKNGFYSNEIKDIEIFEEKIDKNLKGFEIKF